MEKCTDLLKEYLNGRRDIERTVFNVIGTIFRGVNNNRFTLEQAEAKLWERWKEWICLYIVTIGDEINDDTYDFKFENFDEVISFIKIVLDNGHLLKIEKEAS